MLGPDGLRKAPNTPFSIPTSSPRLEGEYKFYTIGVNGTCAHEFVVDLRPFKQSAGIEAEDGPSVWWIIISMHPPSASRFAGTIMVEPTESEDKGRAGPFLRCAAQYPQRNTGPLKKAMRINRQSVETCTPFTVCDYRQWMEPSLQPQKRPLTRWTMFVRINSGHQ